jgi:Ferric reductase like transmembrane component/Class III cytochrome C family
MFRDRRYLALGITLVLAGVAAPLYARHEQLGWEAAEFAGLISGVLCLVLCGYPVRPRESTPAAPLTLRLHEWLGWLALLTAGVHVALLLLIDRPTIEYLKWTLPLYQIAGLVGVVLMLGATVLAIGPVRRRLWQAHRNFQAFHVISAVAVACLVAIHVTVTARYFHGLPSRLIFLGITAGAILMLLRSRRRTRSTPDTASLSSRLSFGRHSTLVAVVIVVLTGSLLALIPPRTVIALRESPVRRHAQLPLDFPHDPHRAVSCVECHHNYTDGTGLDTCIACHRSARKTLKVGAEARFHSFCLDCHRQTPRLAERRGPVAGCVVCHHPANSHPLSHLAP